MLFLTIILTTFDSQATKPKLKFQVCPVISEWHWINMFAAAAVKSLQSCPTLSDPKDCSLPGSSVHGFSRQEYWSQVPCLLRLMLLSSVQLLSRIWLFATPWIAARQASLPITNSQSSLRFMSIVLWPGMTHMVPMLSQNACCGWGVWCHS